MYHVMGVEKLCGTFPRNTNMSATSPCALCGKEAGHRCSQCSIIKYCSRECQASHWKVHKLLCGKTNAPSPLTNQKAASGSVDESAREAKVDDGGDEKAALVHPMRGETIVKQSKSKAAPALPANGYPDEPIILSACRVSVYACDSTRTRRLFTQKIKI